MNTARIQLPRLLRTACARPFLPKPQSPFWLRPLATSSTSRHASVSENIRVDHAEDIGNQTVAAMGRTTSGKALRVRTYPTFENLEQERLYRKQHLAAAYRVFAARGFDEGVAGHISVRDPILTDHFCTCGFRLAHTTAT
jgi:hypothetical protein